MSGIRQLARAMAEWLLDNAFRPMNAVLPRLLRWRVYRNSVLEISYMIHEPANQVKELRKLGIKADYLAVGASPYWNQADYRVNYSESSLRRKAQEFWWFWTVVARYEIIYLHFMITLTQSGWELPLLKRLGRKIIVRYAGCEIRDREKNMSLHPQVNICQECDYNATICRSPLNQHRRVLMARYGDKFLVSTPDMRDFVPAAEHFPFFAPDTGGRIPRESPPRQGGKFKIVHVTAHPGIEGSRFIEQAVRNLQSKGIPIEYVFLRNVPHARVLDELQDADLSIGKLKMGYYANAQIESMYLGVPTVTWVRSEFMTDELRNSGFIFSSLDDLESTLEYFLRNPEALAQKRRLARSSIEKLHDNRVLAGRLQKMYSELKRV